MDFPGNPVLPLHINSFHEFMPGREVHAHGGFANTASYAWPTANLAIYIPLTLPWAYPVERAFWGNGATGGANVNIGIYTPDGARLWSSGSTAQSGTSTVQYVTVTPDLVLAPGRYYLALAMSGTTGLAFGIATAVTAIIGRFSGLYQQASSLVLPASATFAQFASVGYPLCGITRTTTGF